MTLGICNAKNKIRFDKTDETKDHPYNFFTWACNHLMDDRHVDCIVAGCTDIRNVFYPELEGVFYVDSLEVLADSIIKEANNEFSKYL